MKMAINLSRVTLRSASSRSLFAVMAMSKVLFPTGMCVKAPFFSCVCGALLFAMHVFAFGCFYCALQIFMLLLPWESRLWLWLDVSKIQMTRHDVQMLKFGCVFRCVSQSYLHTMLFLPPSTICRPPSSVVLQLCCRNELSIFRAVVS